MQCFALLLTFIQAVLCSSLQLWIAVLTRLADSLWYQDSVHPNMIYVWLSRFLYRAAAGPQQCPALSVGCLWGLASTGRSLTPVDVRVEVWARGEEPPHTNETLLSVSGLHHPTKWKMCVRKTETETETVSRSVVVHMCNVFEGATFVSTFGAGGYFYSCYILWQRCDSVFRSVQTVRLTQRFSPQPQCKSHFLKPVPLLYETCV